MGEDRDDGSRDPIESMRGRTLGPASCSSRRPCNYSIRIGGHRHCAAKSFTARTGKRQHGVLPRAVASLVDEIRQILDLQADPKAWEQIQLSRVVICPTVPCCCAGPR